MFSNKWKSAALKMQALHHNFSDLLTSTRNLYSPDLSQHAEIIATSILHAFNSAQSLWPLRGQLLRKVCSAMKSFSRLQESILAAGADT